MVIRGGTDKSLAWPISPCRRTESKVSLEREVWSCAELQVFSCYRGWKEACRATRAISTTSRRGLSSVPIEAGEFECSAISCHPDDGDGVGLRKAGFYNSSEAAVFPIGLHRNPAPRKRQELLQNSIYKSQFSVMAHEKNKFSLWLYCWRCRIVTHRRHLVVVITLP